MKILQLLAVICTVILVPVAGQYRPMNYPGKPRFAEPPIVPEPKPGVALLYSPPFPSPGVAPLYSPPFPYPRVAPLYFPPFPPLELPKPPKVPVTKFQYAKPVFSMAQAVQPKGCCTGDCQEPKSRSPCKCRIKFSCRH